MIMTAMVATIKRYIIATERELDFSVIGTNKLHWKVRDGGLFIRTEDATR